MHTQILHEHMHLHSLQENTRERLQRTHTGQRCAILFPLGACCIIMPTIHLETRDTEIPVGCCARVYGSKLFNCSPCLWLEPRWWAESELRQHRLKLASHPGSSRLFCCEPIQQCASAHCLFSHSSNRWRRRSHRHQASCASGPICREYDCDCCFKVGAILKCQTPLFQSLTGLLWNSPILFKIDS